MSGLALLLFAVLLIIGVVGPAPGSAIIFAAVLLTLAVAGPIVAVRQTRLARANERLAAEERNARGDAEAAQAEAERQRALAERNYRMTLERDLKLAHDVQHAFLPASQPDVVGYDFFDFYQAADQVAGDYYDYLEMADGRLAVVVADVVGQGIAAAMLMAKLSAEISISLMREASVSGAVNALNQRLCELELNRFVTMVVAVLDPKTHNVTVVSAGHMPPILRRANGDIEEPGQAESGVPLGIVEGMEYLESSIQMQPEESLTVYTDGVNEAANRAGAQYTVARIKRQIATSNGSPQKIGETILEDVRRHLDGRALDDDLCLVVVGRTL